MKQPKLSKTDVQLKSEFAQLETPGTSPVIVAAIGDSFKASNGETQIPVMLVQKTNRFSDGNDISQLARGWGEKILRKVENFNIANLKHLNLKEGSEIKGFNISLVRTLKEQYEGQKPMEINDNFITHKGQHIYQSTVVTFGEPKDKGMEFTYDTVDSGVPVRS